MTAREFVSFLEHYPWPMAGLFLIIPTLSGLLGALHGRDRGGLAPWKYLYAVLVYLACVPGMLADVRTGYALFFTRENLLDVNLLVYVAPILSMVVTLILIGKNVSFDDVPGFDRLSGLMVMLAITFVLALAIQKTKIWLFFGGSVFVLIALVAGLFALLKWGAFMLFRRKDEPRLKPPSFNSPA